MRFQGSYDFRSAQDKEQAIADDCDGDQTANRNADNHPQPHRHERQDLGRLKEPPQISADDKANRQRTNHTRQQLTPPQQKHQTRSDKIRNWPHHDVHWSQEIHHVTQHIAHHTAKRHAKHHRQPKQRRQRNQTIRNPQLHRSRNQRIAHRKHLNHINHHIQCRKKRCQTHVSTIQLRLLTSLLRGLERVQKRIYTVPLFPVAKIVFVVSAILNLSLLGFILRNGGSKPPAHSTRVRSSSLKVACMKRRGSYRWESMCSADSIRSSAASDVMWISVRFWTCWMNALSKMFLASSIFPLSTNF